jgi:ketosteroid isomerase-like protein
MDAREAAHRWADAWKRGWETLDPEPILALYSPDATHLTDPFREPSRGIDAIRAYVERVFAEEEDPRVWMAEPDRRWQPRGHRLVGVASRGGR